MEHTKTKGCLDSLTLKLLAMALMLCDHLWATVLPGVMWLTAVGRIAFPIFAFQVAEGFQRTHDRKKYLLRMLVFALISEIPFNYLYYSSPVFPFHQNVMFTFFIALLLMLGLEKVRSKGMGMYILAAVLSLPVGYFLGTIGMVDYYGSGVVTVLIFYLCRQKPALGALLYTFSYLPALWGGYPEDPLACHLGPLWIGFEFFALLALPLIFFRTRTGLRIPKWFFYGYYPAHLLAIFLVRTLLHI